MLIIGVDPGNEESAVVFWTGEKVLESWYKENEKILELLSNPWINSKNRIGKYGDIVLVVEQIASYGMAVGEEVFETVFWSGRFCEIFPGEWDRLKRMEIKMHLCHDSRAKDGNIRQRLIDKFGPPTHKTEMRDEAGEIVIKKVGKNKGDPKIVTALNPIYGEIVGDLWQAFAVAVTYYEKLTGAKL